MSDNAENFRKEILMFLRIFLVSKSFIDEKFYWWSRFSVENFLVSQCQKFSWATFECLREIGVLKIFIHQRGITSFRRNFCVWQCRKFSYRNPLVFNFNLGINKCLGEIVKIFGTIESRTTNLLLESAAVLTILLSFVFEKKELAVLVR